MPATQTSAPPILITGATGRVGATGYSAVESLRSQGIPVRALVRTVDERAERLRSLGAEIVQGDFMDHKSLVKALADVEAAYFCYPVTSGITEAAGMFAAAGRHTGLKRIVDLSLGNASADAASPQVRAQWIAEQIFEWAGFGGVHLRVAAFFMENIATLDAMAIKSTKRIANCFGDLEISWISGADVGAVAAALLRNADGGAERTLVIGGVEHCANPKLATVLSEITGETITYEEITPKQWREYLANMFAAIGEPNPRAADHLSTQAKSLRESGSSLPVTDHVLKLAGRSPVSLRKFLESRREAFTSVNS